MRGQEVMDTNSRKFKENFVWAQDKIISSENSYTLEYIAQRSDEISLAGNIQVSAWEDPG